MRLASLLLACVALGCGSVTASNPDGGAPSGAAGSGAGGTTGAAGSSAAGGTTGSAGSGAGGTTGSGGSGASGTTGSAGRGGSSGGGACSAVTTLVVCEARADCHAVFTDPHDCACAALGCCSRFSRCADGDHANCKGPAACDAATPYCEGPFTVAYSGACYEGCVRATDCAP